MKKSVLSAAAVFIICPVFSQNTVITVIAPNGGENWTLDCPQIIQWTAVPPAAVKIELYKSNVFYMTICNQVPANQLSYSWTPPYSVTPGNTYRVKVTVVGSTNHDISNGNFSIHPGSITVGSPNGGEIWQMGSTYPILWTDNICEDVRIELWKGSVFNSLITAVTPSSGTFTWTIPNTLTPGNDYRVKILSVEPNTYSNNVFDFSDAHFTICTGQYITVISPNGGEMWARGSTHCITWIDNITQNVRIELWKGNIFQSLITASTPSTGSCYWAIPSTQPVGNDYKVKIMALNSSGNLTLYDFSDNNFSIICMAPPVATLFDNDIKIYPNPCRNILHVRFQQPVFSSLTLQIFSLTGELRLHQHPVNVAADGSVEIDTSPLKHGTYILVVRQNNEVVSRSLFAVTHE